MSEVLVEGSFRIVKGDARKEPLSKNEALKAMGPYDVILLHDAGKYVHDWEAFFSDLATHLLKPKSGKLVFIEDNDPIFAI